MKKKKKANVDTSDIKRPTVAKVKRRYTKSIASEHKGSSDYDRTLYGTIQNSGRCGSMINTTLSSLS